MIEHAYLKELLSYDVETGVFTWRVDRGGKTKAGMKAGSITSHGYICIRINNKGYYAHRLAWLYIYGEWPSEIDHINRVRDDNRIDNLRCVTRRENNHNLTPSPGKSGYRGVWENAGGYCAFIKVDGRRRYLGRFKTAVDASKVYEKERAKCGLP